jgi:psiF repeat
MRFTSIILSSALFLSSTIVVAQTAPVPSVPAPAISPAPVIANPVPVAPTPATPATNLTKDGKPKAKEVRATCKAEAATKNLTKGDAYRAFMKECIGKQRPDLVKSYECRQEARAKKLDKDARATFMKECKAK